MNYDDWKSTELQDWYERPDYVSPRDLPACSFCKRAEYQRVEQGATGDVSRCTVCGETHAVSPVSATALFDRFMALVTNRRRSA